MAAKKHCCAVPGEQMSLASPRLFGPSQGRRHDAAVVQIDNAISGLKMPYQASLFSTHMRLRETGMLDVVDHVLMVCAHVVTHPGIRIVRFNNTEIEDVIRDKHVNFPAFHKLAAFRLVQYSRVLVLDLDTYVVADIRGAFALPAPAMVRWESPTAGPFQPNSGVHLAVPDEKLYDAALGWLRRLPRGPAWGRRAKLHEMLTPWGAFNNRSAATAPDPQPVLMSDSDQHFLFMLYNVLERELFGPLHELPYEYNVKHYMLTDKKAGWSAAAFLTFMSRPEQGHIRIVHLNRDKPWDGAQCGAFHRPFWQAALRGVNALQAGGDIPTRLNLTSLADYVRDSLWNEERQPCKKGAKSARTFVPTISMECIARGRFCGGKRHLFQPTGSSQVASQK